MTDRLYGLPGAEHMQDDLATVYEQWADEHDFLEHADRGEIPDVEIEEWTVREPRTALPSAAEVADRLIEDLLEMLLIDEVNEDAWEEWKDAAYGDVLVAFTRGLEPALDLWASKIRYRMAAELVATHTVTHVDGEPHLDGKPLFPKVAP